eukprot:6427447-Prymnesium_polylepis.2
MPARRATAAQLHVVRRYGVERPLPRATLLAAAHAVPQGLLGHGRSQESLQRGQVRAWRAAPACRRPPTVRHPSHTGAPRVSRTPPRV